MILSSWYRAFPKDEKENAKYLSVDIPLLYLRGDKDYGDINEYVEGIKYTGIKQYFERLEK